MTDKPTNKALLHYRLANKSVAAVQSLAEHLSVDPVALAEQLEKGGLVELFERCRLLLADVELSTPGMHAAGAVDILTKLRSVGGGDG